LKINLLELERKIKFQGISIMSNTKIITLSVVAIALLTTGCQQKTTTAKAVSTSKAVTTTQTVAKAAPAIQASAPVAMMQSSNGGFTLPNAQAGMCYGKVVIPAQYKTVTEKLLATPESTKLSIVPAEYKSGSERVLDTAASTKIQTVPATYKTESRTITVSPASTGWKTGINPDARVASSALLSSARAGGINLETAPSGSCYYEFYSAPQYKTVSEKVLDTAASTRLISKPATFKPGTKRVLVTPESTKLVTVPAQYKTVTEKVQVAPAKKEWKQTKCQDQDCSIEEMMCLVDIPAQYKTVTKQVLVRPESTRSSVIPAQYKTVTSNELASPASTQSVNIPATYKTLTKTQKVSGAKYIWSNSLAEKSGMERTNAVICKVSAPAVTKVVTKRVVATPAASNTINIPATYKTVSKTLLVRAETTRKTVIPATYKTVSKQVQVSPQSVKWMPVLCKSSMTIETISKIQRALTNAGHNTPVTGSLDMTTKASVEAYQRKSGLVVSGLSMDTLKSLGVF
ncbi:MAG: peptidoglycan-binding protein, partial [Sulfurovaceae bacterium]|nr:peptidoglycan-binding protein [Sulfurovaceae bacterium]